MTYEEKLLVIQSALEQGREALIAAVSEIDEQKEQIDILKSALSFMIMAYDSDQDVRRYAGMGDDVTFPALKDSKINSVAEAKLALSKAK